MVTFYTVAIARNHRDGTPDGGTAASTVNA